MLAHFWWVLGPAFLPALLCPWGELFGFFLDTLLCQASLIVMHFSSVLLNFLWCWIACGATLDCWYGWWCSDLERLLSLSLPLGHELGQLFLVVLLDVRRVLVNCGSRGFNGLVLISLLPLLRSEHHEEYRVAFVALLAVLQALGAVTGWAAQTVARFALACKAAVAEVILPQVVRVDVVVRFVL